MSECILEYFCIRTVDGYSRRETYSIVQSVVHGQLGQCRGSSIAGTLLVHWDIYISQAKSYPRLLSNTVCLPVSEASGGRINNMGLLLKGDVDCFVL